MRLTGVLIVFCLCVPVLRGQPRVAVDVVEKSIEELHAMLRDKQVTSRQLVDAYLARIDAYDQRGPALNAVMSLNPHARAAADALDAERASKGLRGPLHGIPLLIKDNYETVEMPTTAGSIALASFHPARDAELVRRLKAAGAVILGKTTMHELAAGITTVGSSFGYGRNPYDLDRTPGGSSGGTGAAVAASFAAAGMGSDTCGSIRIPAGNNNLVGLRGTQGLSSRRGIVPLSSTQDIGGPLARSIADLAIMLDATVGPDERDPQTSLAAGKIPASYRTTLDAEALKGARLGIVRHLFGTTEDDQEVSSVMTRALDGLKKAGAETVDVSIPGLQDLLSDSSMIASDFKFDLIDYLAGADKPPVRSLNDILERGLYHAALESTFRARNATTARETEASRRARSKQATLRQVTEATISEQRLDALVYPALRRRPARVGEAQGGTNCQLSAHAGLPALSVPAGFTGDAVPIGMELLGSAFSEARLLSLGYAIERTLLLRRPPFSTPALVHGVAPARRMTKLQARGGVVQLTYDETTGRLEYQVRSASTQSALPQAIWLHGTAAEGSGPPLTPGSARHLLFNPRAPRADDVRALTLSSAERQDLIGGRLLLRIFASAGNTDVPVPTLATWQPAVTPSSRAQE